MLIPLLLIVAVFTFIDLVPIFMKKQWKLFWTYVVMLCTALTIVILLSLHVEIPSPAGPIKKLVMSILGQSTDY